MDKTTTLLQMAFVLRLESLFVCKLGRLKSPMVRKRGYECSRLKSPMVRKGLTLQNKMSYFMQHEGYVYFGMNNIVS